MTDKISRWINTFGYFTINYTVAKEWQTRSSCLVGRWETKSEWYRIVPSDDNERKWRMILCICDGMNDITGSFIHGDIKRGSCCVIIYEVGCYSAKLYARRIVGPSNPPLDEIEWQHKLQIAFCSIYFNYKGNRIQSRDHNTEGLQI